jgi:2-polyprenyl-6-methoxyphenol hydroxylase-like FAD-dependent oxidoreductase
MMAQAVVVGAGVAGLAAAVALRRLGWDVDVFDERPAAEANAGLGLVLWPNAQAALAALGVPGAGLPDLGLSLLASDGSAISGAGAAELRARLGGCPRLVLRQSLMGDLHRTALAAGASVAYGRRLSGAARHADGWLLALSGGGPARADVVLGCDGIRSATRGVLAPGRHEPRFRSRTAYRGISDATGSAGGAMTEMWGRQGRFGYAPLPGGRTYWFADLPAGRPGGRVDLPALRALFGSWAAPIPEILSGADGATVSAVDVHDLPLLRRWPHRDAALLGDAWHAMTPDLGQGACMALEDAVRIWWHLRQHAGRPALDVFVRRGRARTGAAALGSRAAGAVAQPLPAAAARTRAALMRALPSSVALFPATAFAGRDGATRGPKEEDLP